MDAYAFPTFPVPVATFSLLAQNIFPVFVAGELATGMVNRVENLIAQGQNAIGRHNRPNLTRTASLLISLLAGKRTIRSLA